MSLYQSTHELARISRSSNFITSENIYDFPNIIHDGDILIYKNDEHGKRWVAGPAPEYVNLITNNRLAIEDLSNVKIPEAVNNLIAGAPEAMDTLKEIADIIGNDQNAAGSIINHLHVSDISINYLETWKIDVDISRNAIHMIANNNMTAINSNINSIASHKVQFDNHASATNTSLNNLNVSVTNLDNSYNSINIITTNTVNQVNTNITNISTNTTNITKNADDIILLNTKTQNHDLSLNVIKSNQTLYNANINQNANAIVDLSNSITTNLLKSNANETNFNNHISTNFATANARAIQNESDIIAIKGGSNVTISALNTAIIDNKSTFDTRMLELSSTTLQTTNNKSSINILDASVNTLDISMAKIETETVPRSISNLTKINTNIVDISDNKADIATNTTNIATNTTNLTNLTNVVNNVIDNSGAGLDSIKELADLMGNPNGIASSVLNRLAALENVDVTHENDISYNLNEIETLKTNQTNLNNDLASKQNIISSSNTIPIVSVANLQTSLNQKQPLIRNANKLEIVDINNLQTTLNTKQEIITDNSLTISQVSNLQNELAQKQPLITENSLSQTKIFNLTSSLNKKQDIIENDDLQIAHVQNLQNALNQKQDIITNNSIQIQHVTNLQHTLNQKQDTITAGQNINIDTTNNVISTNAASNLNELNDCKVGGTDFTKCLFIGTTTTGVLNDSNNNIAIGDNALRSLTTADDNIAIGVNALDKCSTKQYNVAIGNSSLFNNEKAAGGEKCTAIGYQSGIDNWSGNNNTYIGYKANCGTGFTDLTNSTAIGFNSTVNSSNTIQLGNSTIEKVKSFGKLDLSDGSKTVTYPNTHNSVAGDVLVIDQNGVASWSAMATYGSKVTDISNALDVVISDICNNDTGLTALNNKFDDLSANNSSWVSTISTINTQLNNNPNFYDTLDAKIDTKVGLTGDETITGQKTFNSDIVANITGNSNTATALQNSITIAGNSFTGIENINISAGQITGIVPLPYETEVQTGSLMPTDLALKVGLIDKDRFLLRADINNNGVNQDISGIITFNHGIVIPETIDLSHNVTQLKDMDNNHVHSGKIITDAERTQITTNKDGITGLTTSKVSVDGIENITGQKTFTNGIVIPPTSGLDGNALTATTLQNSINIAGVPFNGSANIDISVENLSDVTSKGSGSIITNVERTQITTNSNNITTNTNNISTNTTALTNVTNSISYPTAYIHVAYQQTDDQGANYIAPADASASVVTILNTLSQAVETLANELHKLDGNKIVFNNN